MMDPFLQGYIDKYDKWIDQDLISYASKVVPVGEAMDTIQHILPSRQATQILRGARSITLADCVCRQRYKNCGKPLKVCFILNETGEKWVEKGLSQKIVLDEALQVLKNANEHGLVHMTLYKPDHEIFALCSCCSCCCHDLQLVMKYGKEYILIQSDYIAVDDADNCIHCGICADRCEFNARSMDDDRMVYEPDHCYGCGLCVTPCPENVISMKKTIHDG